MSTVRVTRPIAPRPAPSRISSARPAAGHGPASRVATARPLIERAQNWRPSIQVVATRAQRKARPRVFYAIVTVGVIFGIIVSQLLMSVVVSSGAYEIAELQQTNKELGRTYQSMTQDLDRMASPQNLAANAEALGMVSNNTPVYLRLSDGAILGQPVAADASAGVISGARGGLIPNSLLNDVALITEAEAKAAAEAAKKAAEEAAAVAAATAATAPADSGVATPVAPTGPVALSNGLPSIATR